MSPAPFAVLLELYFALHKLAVLARPVVDASTLGAGQFEKLILGHMGETIRQIGLSCNFLTDGIPRQDRSANQRTHNNIDYEPAHKDNDEPYRYVHKCLLCF